MRVSADQLPAVGKVAVLDMTGVVGTLPGGANDRQPLRPFLELTQHRRQTHAESPTT